MESGGYRCRSSRYIESGQSAVPSSVLFAAGLLGNVLALLLLGQHRWRSRSPGGRPPRVSAFYVLVSGLAVTDLLGKCLISPIVLAAYAYNRSLSELGPGGRTEDEPGVLCQLFAFLMAFFGLAPTLLLLAMALECWLSLGHPYFYRRHFTRRLGATLGPAAAGLCALFCALPLLGFGVPMQYCPGTWCFIRMAGNGPRQLGFPVLYASLMGLLVLAIGACNVSSMRHLYGMARRQPRRGAPAAAAPRMEELDHLILLGLMTVLFTICSLPLIVSNPTGPLPWNSPPHHPLPLGVCLPPPPEYPPPHPRGSVIALTPLESNPPSPPPPPKEVGLLLWRPRNSPSIHHGDGHCLKPLGIAPPISTTQSGGGSGHCFCPLE